MQPIKVLFIAMFVALIVKKLEDEEKSNVEKQARNLAQDEEWLHPSSSDSEQENKKEKKPRFNPSACAPSKEELSRARDCLLYTSPSPRDKRQSRMPSSA